ncbi:hypothetical protein WS68_01955 [Burkholderia sp. TSV86]|nr:hypothetical protein WS68_01955 [Burkholderia sp. TSV86]
MSASLDMSLCERRSHAVTKRDQWKTVIGSQYKLGQLGHVAEHISPCREAGLPQPGLARRPAMPAQIECDGGITPSAQIAGEPVIAPAMFTDSMRNLYDGAWHDARGWSPFTIKNLLSVYMRRER